MQSEKCDDCKREDAKREAKRTCPCCGKEIIKSTDEIPFDKRRFEQMLQDRWEKIQRARPFEVWY